MKKVFSFVTMSLALALSASFISCKAPSGGGNEGPQATYIGTKAPTKAKAVGDIVFADGSTTPYTAELTLTDDQKSKAIAVIYKVDGSKAFGVGLVHSQSRLSWCISSAKGYKTVLTDLRCEVSGSAGDYSFTGDTDGSDNFIKIAEDLGEDDDTEIAGNYPAFEFAKNYKNQTNSHVSGTAYENGWYLPTLSELADIWKEKSTVEAASALCEGSQFGSTYYWSSSQHTSKGYIAYQLRFSTGEWHTDTGDKLNMTFVCCIRVF